MKQLEISRLMDEYQDNEFCPEEGSAASAAAVKARVLAQAAPAKTWRRPPLKAALIAAALVVGLVATAAAADLPMKMYKLVTGDSMVIQLDPTGQHYLRRAWEMDGPPVTLENGRLWLVIEDERIDVTNFIDEETPYIVEGEDPESGLKNYLIVGGTPEDYGWFMWAELPLGGYDGGGWNSHTDYFEVDGELVNVNDWWAENGDGITTPLRPGVTTPEKMVTIDKPWYLNSYNQLGLWD